MGRLHPTGDRDSPSAPTHQNNQVLLSVRSPCACTANNLGISSLISRRSGPKTAHPSQKPPTIPDCPFRYLYFSTLDADTDRSRMFLHVPFTAITSQLCCIHRMADRQKLIAVSSMRCAIPGRAQLQYCMHTGSGARNARTFNTTPGHDMPPEVFGTPPGAAG